MGALPSRDELLAFISGEAAPSGEKPTGRVTKREIARAFGVKGEARNELKLLIKDLEADGAVTRGRKTLVRQGRLPAMVVAEIVARDRDGELVARPPIGAKRAKRRAFWCAAPSSGARPRPRRASARAC